MKPAAVGGRTDAEFEEVERVAVEPVEQRHESQREVNQQRDAVIYSVSGVLPLDDTVQHPIRACSE